MDSWISVDALVGELELDADPSDREDVRAAIRKAISEVHPDKTGGQFPDANAESRYGKLVSALHFVDKAPSTALVPIDQIPALVAAIRQSIAIPQPTTVAQSRSEFREIARSDIRQTLFLPRIGSGVFAAACTFLLTVGDKFAKDPLVGPWIASPTGHLLALTGLGYSAALFVATWWMEQRSAVRSEWLLAEEGRRAVLSEVAAGSLRAAEQGQASEIRFRFSHVVDVIRGRGHRRVIIPFNARISAAAAEKLAKTNLDDLEDRGIVRKVNGRTLDVEYAIDPDVAKELAFPFRSPAI